MDKRKIGSLVCFLFLSAVLSFAVAQDGSVTVPQDGEEKPDSPYGDNGSKGRARLSNDVLDCVFLEDGSELWQYQYTPGHWGESCWREHYAIYSGNHGNTMESDDPGFQVIVPFDNPGGGPGTILAVLQTRDDAFEVSRTITMLSGPVRFFKLDYVVTNISSVTQADVRFFETIDFDIPETGDHEDDYGYYDEEDDYIWIVDWDYFQNGIESELLSDHHGMEHYTIEIYDDWDDGLLNDHDNYGPGDPGIGKQFNLGEMYPGESRQINMKIWFGVPINCETDAECSDGLYCNGEEYCDSENECQPAANEVPCDDGLFCNGVEICDEDADACLPASNPCEDDGLICNGTESCDEDLDECVHSGNPCGDDGLFCNGEEICEEGTGECTPSGYPCEEDETCDEENDICVGDPPQVVGAGRVRLLGGRTSPERRSDLRRAERSSRFIEERLLFLVSERGAGTGGRLT